MLYYLCGLAFSSRKFLRLKRGDIMEIIISFGISGGLQFFILFTELNILWSVISTKYITENRNTHRYRYYKHVFFYSMLNTNFYRNFEPCTILWCVKARIFILVFQLAVVRIQSDISHIIINPKNYFLKVNTFNYITLGTK